MASHFQVVIPGGSPASVAEWERAMTAPISELPDLTEEQRQMADKFAIPEEEYRRGLLVGRYGDMRQYERGKLLGEAADSVVRSLYQSSYYFVQSVLFDAPRDRWIIELMAGNAGAKKVAVDPVLADAVIEAGTEQDLASLRSLLSGLVKANKGDQTH